jgi:hypothetical protein
VVPRQDIEDDVGGMDAAGERLGARRLDRGEAIAEYRRQDFDHLPVAVIRALQPAAHPLQMSRQHPVFEGRAVSERARLSGQHRDVMPGVVDRLITSETARMLGDDRAVLADHDTLGIGLDLD